MIMIIVSPYELHYSTCVKKSITATASEGLTLEDSDEDNCFITVRQEGGRVVSRKVPKGYYGDVKVEYERRNEDYQEEAEGYYARG